MCNVWKFSPQNSHKQLNELSTDKIKNFLEEITKLGTKYLCLSGGEPTLRRDLTDIIEKAKTEGLIVSLITNGTLMNDVLAKKLVHSGLDEIVFSLDSSTAIPHDTLRGVNGTYEKAVQGMKAINTVRTNGNCNKPKIVVNYAVTSLTCQYIEDIIDLKSQLGFDEIFFLPINPKTARANNLLLSYDDLEKLWNRLPAIKARMEKNQLSTSSLGTLAYMCRNREAAVQGKYSIPVRSQIICFQPWQLATVDPFGNVYPCCFACTFQNLQDENLENGLSVDPYNMGNINLESFTSIWNGDRFRWFRGKAKQPLAFKMCYSCNYSARNDMLLTGLFSKPRLLLTYINEFLRSRHDQTQTKYFIT
jgi:MoaA/NifB/PqqE/SkfB family radical SAM enzyme